MVKRDLRIVFMGTPAFAVPTLQILKDAGYPIIAVITAPDKEGGRGKSNLIVSPVKSFALEQGLHVLQPANLKSKSFLDELSHLNADLQVVVAFRMLPEVVWRMPRLGTMNLHASLLPAYRGAAPIQWAIINGERITGLTTFLLQHEIDSGAIIRQREIPILPEDNAGTLHDRMMDQGAGLVLGSVDLLASGHVTTTAQDHARISHAPKIDHTTGHLDWKWPVHKLHNMVRAMSPYPGAWTVLDGKELKVYKTRIHEGDSSMNKGQATVQNSELIIQALDGAIVVEEVQLTGKKRMRINEFLNGYRIKDWQLT